MFGDTDGKRDAMLRFTKPVTGGYYFAPSIERLLALYSFLPLPLGEGWGEGNRPHPYSLFCL